MCRLPDTFVPVQTVLWRKLLGAVVCVVMFATRVGAGDWRAPLIAGVLLLGVAALYFVLRLRAVTDKG